MLEFGFYNMDCMEGLKEFPDQFFDLAIIDPPYGAGFTKTGGCRGWFSKYNQRTSENYETNENIEWDQAPGKEYFTELFRVSKNQIIWGGNYFELPPTRCFLIWEKLSISENFTMGMAEYAWTSFNGNSKIFKHSPQGTQKEKRFHPTQKPIALYEWILNRYAKEGDVILDTHVGSASSLIACHRTGHKYVGFEIDKNYYDLAKERLREETSQLTFYDFKESIERDEIQGQITLFDY